MSTVPGKREYMKFGSLKSAFKDFYNVNPDNVMITKLKNGVSEPPHDKICFLQMRKLKAQISFLAHLSRRLMGELIVYRSSRRPSVRPLVRPCVHTFKHEYLRNQWANCNQILSEASLGWGKGCVMFSARSDWNSGFHGNG